MTVPSSYASSPLIENTGCASFGNAPCFAEDTASTLVTGPNSLGDLVWRDLNRNQASDGGSETGIGNISLTLYYDANSNSALDSTDPQIATTISNASTGAYSFSNLPDGRYIVKVDATDTDVPTGFAITTSNPRAVDLDSARVLATPVSNTTIDFGFAPVLFLDKVLTSSTPTYDSADVTYSLLLRNNQPGDGSGPTSACQYLVWASAEGSGSSGQPNGKRFLNTGTNAPPPTNLFGSSEPNSTYAYGDFTGGSNRFVTGTSYSLGAQSGTITKVEALFPLYIDTMVADDQATGEVSFGGTSLGSTTISNAELNSRIGVANSAYYVWNVTSLRSWQRSDFSGTNLVLRFDLAKVSAADSGNLYLDALGFRVTTSENCGSADDTIDPLPLTDTYDSTRLQFVSASVTPSSTSAGTLTWSNLGPLYAGGTKEIKLTFRALNTTSQVTANNTATVDSATFTTGRDTNDVTDSATVTINPGFSIGDTIWNDTNGDRTQNVGELGLSNVKLTLQLKTGSNSYADQATTTTDSNGTYIFRGLDTTALAYRVTVDTTTLPGGSTNWTNTKDRDSGAANGNSNSGDITTTNSADVTDADFGYRRTTPTIVGSVWNDWNGSATTSADAGEEGLSTVTVRLNGGPCTNGTPTATCTTTTDSSGNFVFASTSLTAATYSVTVDATTLSGGASAWSQTFDTDGTGSANVVSNLVLTANGTARADFSYRKTGTLTVGDTVYRDWNGDSSQGTGEDGIAGVTVYLYEDANGNGTVDSSTDALYQSTTTNSNGIYSFTNVPNGTFIIQVASKTLPSGLNPTDDPDTVINGESRFTVTSGAVASIGGVTCTTCNLIFDYGYQPIGTGKIGDFVWYDVDADGVQDSGEPGIANITVSLYEDTDGDGVLEVGGDDSLLSTTTTDADGGYLFQNLGLGRYWAVVNSADSDLPESNDQPYSLTTAGSFLRVIASAGQSHLDADFGFTALAQVGDTVWQDSNADGSQDISEPGLAGVIVELRHSGCTAGSTCPTDTTDANGRYLFSGLPAGSYTVAVLSGVPASFVQTYESDVAFTDSSTCASGCDQQSTVTLAAGQADLSLDFGYRPANKVGDYVWFERNGNGVQESGEPGLSAVTVYLCTTTPCNSGAATSKAYTDGDGYYSFGDLADGTYYVAVDTSTVSSSFIQSYDADGTGTANQSTFTVSGSTGGANNGTVTAIGGVGCSSCNLTLDFGYTLGGPRAMSGTTFFDTGNNGELYAVDPANVPYESITAYLWLNNGTKQYLGSDPTGSTGLYSFTNLPDNTTYAVGVDSNSTYLTGLDLKQGFTDAPNGDAYRSTIAVAGSDVTQRDFGFYGDVDFGDLPTTYNGVTKLKSEGARHTIGSLKLGAVVDGDPDGQPSSTSTGDTNDDGVTTVQQDNWSQGSGGTVNVTATGGTGYLSGWADWNNDGDFADSGEKIVTDQAISGSNQPVSFAIPVSTLSGTYNSRFRLYPSSTADTSVPQGLASNGEVEDYQWSFAPTAVELGSFTATAGADQIVLDWETVSELENLGFNVYRATSVEGARAQLNPELIPSQAPGSGMGFAYQWVDSDVQAGVTYFYWLEDVDFFGQSGLHGPVDATLPRSAIATISLQQRWQGRSASSNVWSFYADGTFADSAGQGGTWRYLSTTRRLFVQYSSGQQCQAYYLGVVRGSAASGKMLCRDGSDAKGQWQGTLSGSLTGSAPLVGSNR